MKERVTTLENRVRALEEAIENRLQTIEDAVKEEPRVVKKEANAEGKREDQSNMKDNIKALDLTVTCLKEDVQAMQPKVQICAQVNAIECLAQENRRRLTRMETKAEKTECQVGTNKRKLDDLNDSGGRMQTVQRNSYSRGNHTFGKPGRAQSQPKPTSCHACKGHDHVLGRCTHPINLLALALREVYPEIREDNVQVVRAMRSLFRKIQKERDPLGYMASYKNKATIMEIIWQEAKSAKDRSGNLLCADHTPDKDPRVLEDVVVRLAAETERTNKKIFSTSMSRFPYLW